LLQILFCFYILYFQFIFSFSSWAEQTIFYLPLKKCHHCICLSFFYIWGLQVNMFNFVQA
jgi:hypothetical protein